MNRLILLALAALAVTTAAQTEWDSIEVTVKGSVTGSDAKKVVQILNQSTKLIEKTFKKMGKKSNCIAASRAFNPTIKCVVEGLGGCTVDDIAKVVKEAGKIKKTHKLLEKGMKFSKQVDAVELTCNGQPGESFTPEKFKEFLLTNL